LLRFRFELAHPSSPADICYCNAGLIAVPPESSISSSLFSYRPEGVSLIRPPCPSRRLSLTLSVIEDKIIFPCPLPASNRILCPPFPSLPSPSFVILNKRVVTAIPRLFYLCYIKLPLLCFPSWAFQQISSIVVLTFPFAFLCPPSCDLASSPLFPF